MARLMIHRNILNKFPKLPSKVQKSVSNLIKEFELDPHSTSIGLHPLKGTTLDPKVRSVTKFPDGYRAIVIAPDKGDTYLLVNIDTHDKAYAWAKNMRFDVHEMTGVFQIFDAEEVQTMVSVSAQPLVRSDYFVALLSNDELFAAGVPKALIPAVKLVQSDDDVDALSESLPTDSCNVLYGVAAGMTLDDAVNDVLGRAVVPEDLVLNNPGDFSKLHESLNQDLFLIREEEELRRLLDGPLELLRPGIAAGTSGTHKLYRGITDNGLAWLQKNAALATSIYSKVAASGAAGIAGAQLASHRERQAAYRLAIIGKITADTLDKGVDPRDRHYHV